MRVEVAYLLPDDQSVATVDLAEGASIADALDAVRQAEPFVNLNLDEMPVGVFGELAERTRTLQEGDRVELYRPLEMDPREARRRRGRD